MLGLRCCSGFSLVVASGRYSPVAVRGLQSASSVVAHRLSCSAARGIFLHQWSNLGPCIGRQTPHPWAIREAPSQVHLKIPVFPGPRKKGKGTWIAPHWARFALWKRKTAVSGLRFLTPLTSEEFLLVFPLPDGRCFVYVYSRGNGGHMPRGRWDRM